MKHLYSILSFLVALFVSFPLFAQLVISPNPVSSELQINKSNSYIYFSNSGTTDINLSLSITSNVQGINLSVNRCPTVLKPKISCYIIVSYPNYNKSLSTANVYLKKDAIDFVLLKYSPTVIANESLSISPSSINFGSFSKPIKSGLHHISITNNGTVPYIPILEKSSSVDIALNRCSTTLAPNKSCVVSIKFNSNSLMSNGAQSGLFFSAKPSALATASTVTLNASISYAPVQMTGLSYSPDRTRIYISGNNFGYISSVKIFEGLTEIDNLIIENQTTNLLVLKASKDIDLVSGIDYIFRLL